MSVTRRSKRAEINGWLIVDKKEGYTSTALVNKIRWLLNARKAGHAGTLDPDATGILAVALGEATKTIPYLTAADKSYEFLIHFGTATDTDDTSGSKIKTSKYRPTNEELLKILKCFRGMIKQVPPKYSAVKINGDKAYKLSRSGVTDLNLEARPLLVKKLDLIKRIDRDSVLMKMICGKGGYVRSIARDIGEQIGCFAHAGHIRRLSSGPFSLSDCISDDLIFKENVPKILENILPIHSSLNNLARFDCLIDDANEIKNGKKIPISGKAASTEAEIYVCFNDEPIAIGKLNNNYFYPKKVFSFVTDR